MNKPTSILKYQIVKQAKRLIHHIEELEKKGPLESFESEFLEHMRKGMSLLQGKSNE